jgi:hypothetical protein
MPLKNAPLSVEKRRRQALEEPGGGEAVHDVGGLHGDERIRDQ